jgi:hypothetical protein
MAVKAVVNAQLSVVRAFSLAFVGLLRERAVEAIVSIASRTPHPRALEAGVLSSPQRPIADCNVATAARALLSTGGEALLVASASSSAAIAWAVVQHGAVAGVSGTRCLGEVVIGSPW